MPANSCTLGSKRCGMRADAAHKPKDFKSFPSTYRALSQGELRGVWRTLPGRIKGSRGSTDLRGCNYTGSSSRSKSGAYRTPSNACLRAEKEDAVLMNKFVDLGIARVT